MFLVSKCRRDWHLDLCTFGYLHKENPRAMPNSDFPVDKTLSLGLTRFITKVTTRRIAYLSISRYPKLKSQQSNHSWVVMRSHMRFSVVFRRHSDSFSPGVISRVAHQWLIMLRPWRSFFQRISWPWKEGGLSLQQGVQGGSFFQLSYDSQKWKRRRTEGGPTYTGLNLLHGAKFQRFLSGKSVFLNSKFQIREFHAHCMEWGEVLER